MSTWTGQEKFDCYCGKPAFVRVSEEGTPEMICFAHSYESGLFASLPKIRPEDFETFCSPTREESKLLHDAGEVEHPLVLAYIAGRKRVRQLIAEGMRETHPVIQEYLQVSAGFASSNEDIDRAWDALDDEEKSYIRNYEKKAPPWRPKEEDES